MTDRLRAVFFFDMNKAAIVNDLKRMIGPGVEVDDTGLAVWVNDAYMYMVDEITKVNPDFFTDTATNTTTTGRSEYDLPSDFEKMIMVNAQYDGQWTRVLPIPLINNVPVLADTSLYTQYTAAQPGFYIYGDQLGMIPAALNDTDTIKLWYVYTPAELSADSDTPEFPAKYHHIIKLGAYANYLDQDDEHVAAENMRRRFERRVEEMVEGISENQVDQPKSVSITQNMDMYLDDTSY